MKGNKVYLKNIKLKNEVQYEDSLYNMRKKFRQFIMYVRNAKIYEEHRVVACDYSDWGRTDRLKLSIWNTFSILYLCGGYNFYGKHDLLYYNVEKRREFMVRSRKYS